MIKYVHSKRPRIRPIVFLTFLFYLRHEFVFHLQQPISYDFYKENIAQFLGLIVKFLRMCPLEVAI